MRRNRIIRLSEDSLSAILDGIVVKDTTQYCSDRVGLIYLPESDRMDMDKQVEIGEVVSIGSNVPEGEMQVGDVVIYRRLTAFWIPNGLGLPRLWKIEYPYSILTVIPKDG